MTVTRPTPDLRYGQTEEDLRATVRDLLDDRCPWPSVLARVETSEPNDAALWHSLATELGCGGLLIPEARGGAGASHRETAVWARETGPPIPPLPVLGSAVGAATALLSRGRDAPTGLC